MAVTYTTLTVGRSGGPAFTVGRTATAAAFTVRGYSGAIVGLLPDLVLLTEAGGYLTTEAGDLILTA